MARLTFETAALREALATVRAAVARTSSIPILSAILIEAAGASVTITGNDTDVMAARRLSVEADGPARIAVDGHRLADIVGAFAPGGQTVIEEASDGSIAVRSGRARFRFSTLKADDFPDLPQKAVAAEWTMPVVDLLRPVNAVRHAASTEVARYYLCGVFVHVENGRMVFVTTDGHRAAQFGIDTPLGAQDMPDTIIPTRLIDLVRGSLEPDADVLIRVGDDKLSFVSGSLTIVGKAIAGTFPDYKRVWPGAPSVEVDLDPGEMAAAIGRVEKAMNEKTRCARFDFDRDRVAVSATSVEHGAAQDEIACDARGGPISAGFNCRYFRDSLAALDADTARIGLQTPTAPIRITAIPEGPLSLVIMPTRI